MLHLNILKRYTPDIFGYIFGQFLIYRAHTATIFGSTNKLIIIHYLTQKQHIYSIKQETEQGLKESHLFF